MTKIPLLKEIPDQSGMSKDGLTLMNQGTLGLIQPHSGTQHYSGDQTVPLSSSGMGRSKAQASGKGAGNHSSPQTPAGNYGIQKVGESSGRNVRDPGHPITGSNTLYEATAESPSGHADSPAKTSKGEGDARMDAEIQSTLKRRHSPVHKVNDENSQARRDGKGGEKKGLISLVPLRLEGSSSRSSRVRLLDANLDEIDQKIINEGF